MPHHRREGFYVHAVFQRRGHEGMPEIVEPDFGALGPFQDPAQQLPDCRRVPRRVLFFGRRETFSRNPRPPGTVSVAPSRRETGQWYGRRRGSLAGTLSAFPVPRTPVC